MQQVWIDGYFKLYDVHAAARHLSDTQEEE